MIYKWYRHYKEAEMGNATFIFSAMIFMVDTLQVI